jgi:hypothetical protein
MMDNQSPNIRQDERNSEMLKVAQKRVAFKRSLSAYFIVNFFLALIWYWTDAEHSIDSFWPKWVMFGWGIGLAFQYLRAYHSKDIFNVDKEYEKLKNDRG